MGVAIVAILVCVVFAATGRGGELARFPGDYAPPDFGAMAAVDVALLRPPTALWGYHMQLTDEALSQIATAISARDVRIATLEQQVADLRSKQPPSHAGMAPPDAIVTRDLPAHAVDEGGQAGPDTGWPQDAGQREPPGPAAPGQAAPGESRDGAWASRRPVAGAGSAGWPGGLDVTDQDTAAEAAREGEGEDSPGSGTWPGALTQPQPRVGGSRGWPEPLERQQPQPSDQAQFKNHSQPGQQSQAEQPPEGDRRPENDQEPQSERLSPRESGAQSARRSGTKIQSLAERQQADGTPAEGQPDQAAAPPRPDEDAPRQPDEEESW
jgi:hypothetical protein